MYNYTPTKWMNNPLTKRITMLYRIIAILSYPLQTSNFKLGYTRSKLNYFT